MAIKNFFSGLFHSRDKPVDDRRLTSDWGRFDFLFGGTMSGKTVNERTAMQTTAVLACVKVISEAVASLPLHVYLRKDNGDSEKAFNHPLYNLLHLMPNTEMTAYTFIETALTHLLVYGNFYAQVIRDGRGYPAALYPLLPNRMDVSRNAEKKLVYSYSADNGVVTLTPWDVLHIPGLGFDGIIGYSPIALAKNSIGMAIATEDYGSAFFKNGASPGAVLEFPGPVKDVQRVKESWNAGYKGADNAHKVAVLEEGAKFQTIGIPPNEAQFLETRRYQLEEIARIYRVPLHLVGDLEHATFSNVEHMSLDFTKFTLTPWVRRIEQALEKSLLPPSELNRYYVKFSVEGLLRGDYKSRMEGYAVGRQNGWLSSNDIRDLENLNRLSDADGGNTYLVNGSMIPVSMCGQQYVKQEEGSNETKT
jgi:HK97 family phage portal protein